MRALASLFVFFAASAALPAQGLVMVKPMMPADVVVELKSGLSASDVEADVKQHHLAHAPSAEELKAIQLAGANTSLLATVQSPAILASQVDATMADLDYAAQQKRSQLEDRPQYWIYAEIKGRYPDGGIVATCLSFIPSQQASTLPSPKDKWIHFAKAPPPFKTEDGHYLINCEAAAIGTFDGVDPQGNPFTAADLEMVRNLGPLSPIAPGNANSTAQAAPHPASAPARPPLQLRAKIPFNQWLNLASYGGPNVRVHVYSLDMTAIRLRFDGWSGPKQIPINRGSDAKTLLLDDGHG
ncbi:MAG: hypothetical protein QM796_04820 [Chthoniobacteraceae bacterium]